MACNATMFGMDDNGNKTYNSIDELATAMIEVINNSPNHFLRALARNEINKAASGFNSATKGFKHLFLDRMEILNEKHSLGFATAINHFRTQNTNNPNPSRLEKPDTPTPSLTTQTFSHVSITAEDIKNAIAEEPTVHLNDSEDEDDHGKKSKTKPTPEPTKPVYTFTHFLGSPWFMGVVTVSVAAIAYIYWRKEKNRHDDDQDMAVDNPEEVTA